VSKVQVLQSAIKDRKFVDRLKLAINDMEFSGISRYPSQFVPPTW
jgi:hypothetical protein